MKKILIFVIIISALGCSGTDSVNNVVAALFLPNLSNQWSSSRNTRFFFIAEKRDVNESAFIGSEQGGGSSNELTGNFKNYDVQFTFTEGPEKGVTYKGNFIKDSKPLTMQVTNNVGVKITIEQR